MAGYLSIIEENIKHGKSQSYFYEIRHPEIFNIIEQKRLRHEIRNLAQEADLSLPVLDVASGTGNIAKYLRQHWSKVIACDISVDMLKENECKYKVTCDVCNLPFEDGKFGTVTASSVFILLPEPVKALEEICRVAAKKSVLYFDRLPFDMAHRKTLKGRGFTVFDLMTWFAWLMLHLKYLRRALEYTFNRRKILRDMPVVNVEILVPNRIAKAQFHLVLEKHNFKVETVPYRLGNFIIARRSE